MSLYDFTRITELSEPFSFTYDDEADINGLVICNRGVFIRLTIGETCALLSVALDSFINLIIAICIAS